MFPMGRYPAGQALPGCSSPRHLSWGAVPLRVREGHVQRGTLGPVCKGSRERSPELPGDGISSVSLRELFPGAAGARLGLQKS